MSRATDYMANSTIPYSTLQMAAFAVANEIEIHIKVEVIAERLQQVYDVACAAAFLYEGTIEIGQLFWLLDQINK